MKQKKYLKDIIIYLLILYNLIGLKKNNQRVVIKRHSFERAMQRKIHPNLIEDCIQMGEIKRFGKNKMRFKKRLKKGIIICVGVEESEEIKIITNEMIIMNCSKCGGKLVKRTGFTPEGFEYNYLKCGKCGNEIVNLKQLHDVAQKYREMKKYSVKISKWGDNLAMRFPKELAKQYNIKNEKQITLIPEKKSIKIIT